MATEIERKFLVTDRSFADCATERLDIRQAYLSSDPDATVRLRICGEKAWLTVKSRNHGAERGEWEYPIPVADALEMIQSSGRPCLHKTRHIIPAADGLRWEVDEFHNPCPGLVVAEIELPAADTPFAHPAWLGREVTGDPQYYNSVIAARLG